MFEAFKKFFGGNKSMLSEGMLRLGGMETAISPRMAAARQVWRDMYENPNGLHLPRALAFEMARMITLELHSSVTGSARADFLNKFYSRVIEDIRIPVEYGCAKGGLVMKPYISVGEIKVDFIQGDEVYPTAYDQSGNITGVIFVQSLAHEGMYFTRLEKHEIAEDGYRISNRAFKSRVYGSLGREISLNEVPQWRELAQSVTIANVKRPLFGYFRPAVANGADSKSPVGVSVFANAVNLIKDADRQYERLMWEFESGERALIANSMAFKRDRNGNLRLPDKRLYRTLDVEDVDFFREWSPQLREKELTEGLDTIYRQIEFNCGFAYGTLSTIDSRDRTAEEIRNSKQRSYSTITDNQKALRNALSDLVYAMDVWCTLGSLAPMGEYSISFEFDDSIAADRKTEFEEKNMLVSQGVMAPWEMRMWYFGEDEETAKGRLEVNN